MKISNQELIEKFLQDRLTEGEQKIFAHRESSEEFQLLLEEASVTAFGRSELKSTLRTISEKHRLQEEKPKAKVFNLGRTLSAAAVFIGLLAVAWFGLRPNSMDANTMYAKYYEAYPSITETRGDNDQNLLFNQAMSAYNEKEYEQAETIFTKLEEQQKLSSLESFYLGQSFLAQEKSEKAITYLQKSAENPAHFIFAEANYYLALAHLQNNDSQAAKEILEKIATDTENTRNKTAKEMLKKLK